MTLRRQYEQMVVARHLKHAPFAMLQEPPKKGNVVLGNGLFPKLLLPHISSWFARWLTRAVGRAGGASPQGPSMFETRGVDSRRSGS